MPAVIDPAVSPARRETALRDLEGQLPFLDVVRRGLEALDLDALPEEERLAVELLVETIADAVGELRHVQPSSSTPPHVTH